MVDKETRYYAIHKSNNVTEYQSLADLMELENIQLGVIDKFRNIFAPNGGHDYRLSKFEFYNPVSKNVGAYRINSWEIIDILITYKSSTSIHYTITIVDPLRERRDINFQITKVKYSSDMPVVLEALKEFHLLIDYSNWKTIDVVNENIALKKEIETLKAKLQI